MDARHDDSPPTTAGLIPQQLKNLRRTLDLSQRALSARIRYAPSHIADVERGRRLPSEDMARALDELFAPPLPFTSLLATAQSELVADYGRMIVQRENDAVRIQAFTSSVIPGLLQTEEYARELLSKGLPRESPESIAARVEARMARKKIFDREDPPLYRVVMDECALMRRLATNTAMCKQFRFLLDIAAHSHVTIQILPVARGIHAMQGGSLTVLSLHDGSTVATVESFKSGDPTDSPSRVSELLETLDTAKVDALTPADSLTVIQRYLEECENAA
ncbi:helix-turn-helix transcriptional regulator [Streptomyces calidiresistens]|uniref:Helix-turn-helix domain-containing protein n=1 Tax=Streptomyces calidiresistens TaxID=1485586 RepID=A0A7W3T0X9_9ACTN|nr:helix-turn-helix transcriptional regulator [Streptomyces calidiresistens]MBB0228900.1 helix-turn-helix domain-containing protein [Streptomyces calidiresistens]